MDTSSHALGDLFDQLGLDSWEEAINRFIEDNGDLDAGISLVDAPFWNDAQRTFLNEAIEEDSDWAEVVDHLDALLRSG